MSEYPLSLVTTFPVVRCPRNAPPFSTLATWCLFYSCCRSLSFNVSQLDIHSPATPVRI